VLYDAGGLYRFYPLFDQNMPGAQNNRAAANFGSVQPDPVDSWWGS